MLPESQLVVAGALAVFALVVGAAPERWLAGVLFASAGLHELCGSVRLGPPEFSEAWAYVTCDLLAACVICGVALRANRLYTLWLGGAQLTTFVLQFWRMNPKLPLAQAHNLVAHTILDIQLCILLTGVVCHVRRQRKLDRCYPAWSQ
jgi:hypothetical protein